MIVVVGKNHHNGGVQGCNYNMKIVIRGDRNTGKSCLLARLQGKPFIEEYKPTEEIQVASINWSYKNTEDIVKVEVWDVVDVAKKRKKLAGLKVSGDTDEYEPGLDAEFIDVYKGTHGAILLLDITKPWTMEYVRKEAMLIPSNIPILILANHTDMGHHRQVSQLQVADFVENLQREGQDVAEVSDEDVVGSVGHPCVAGQVGRVQLEEWLWIEVPPQVLQCSFPDLTEAKLTSAAGGE
jgi:GTPase SAR1 family protein